MESAHRHQTWEIRTSLLSPHYKHNRLERSGVNMVSSISVTLIVIILYGGRTATTAFSPQYRHSSYHHQSSKKIQTSTTTTSLCMISDREAPDEEGADMAAQFFKAVSERDISFEGGKYRELFFVVSLFITMHNNLYTIIILFSLDEIDFADADESEMLNDDGETVVYEGGDNASVELDDDDDAILREYDVTSGSALTNEQIYDEMKDRVFESAGAFVELTKGADESGTSEEDGFKGVYQPPSTEPDSGLTAGEVLENGEYRREKSLAFAAIALLYL